MVEQLLCNVQRKSFLKQDRRMNTPHYIESYDTHMDHKAWFTALKQDASHSFLS